MANVYVNLTGSGDKSGSSFANAAAITDINAAILKAGPGGNVLLQADAGPYAITAPLSITAGGESGAPVTIKGVSSTGADMAVTITGTRNPVYTPGMAMGNELFKLQNGANNLTFKNMTIDNTGIAFRAGADISNITISDVTSHNVARFFEDYASGANKTASVSGLTIKDVTVLGFSKGVVNIGYDSHDILIQNVKGNSLRQDGDDFAIGVHLTGTVHDAQIIKTSMANCVDTLSGYWNGDGFATERGVYRVLFQDTVASGNTDAGYDIKSTQTLMIRAEADDNKKNFRIWGETTIQDSVGRDPHWRGGTGGQLQVEIHSGGKANIVNSKFIDSGTDTVTFSNNGTLNTSHVSIVHAVGSLIAKGENAKLVNVSDITNIAGTGTSSSSGIDIVKLKLFNFNPVDAFTEAAGTTAIDHFNVNSAATNAKVHISGFGHDDILVVSSMLKDVNNDGIVGLNASNKINLNSSSTLQIEDVKALRYLGMTDGGFAYGDKAVRPKGAIEGTTANEIKTGDAKDKNVEKFFFDTADGLSWGQDQIKNFGTKDFLVTTSALKLDAQNHVVAGTNGFALHPDSVLTDNVALTDTRGAAVTALEFDGDAVINGVHYYVYSQLGSVADSGLLI